MQALAGHLQAVEQLFGETRFTLGVVHRGTQVADQAGQRIANCALVGQHPLGGGQRRVDRAGRCQQLLGRSAQTRGHRAHGVQVVAQVRGRRMQAISALPHLVHAGLGGGLQPVDGFAHGLGRPVHCGNQIAHLLAVEGQQLVGALGQVGVAGRMV